MRGILRNMGRRESQRERPAVIEGQFKWISIQANVLYACPPLSRPYCTSTEQPIKSQTTQIHLNHSQCKIFTICSLCNDKISDIYSNKTAAVVPELYRKNHVLFKYYSSVVEPCVSSAKGCGFESQGTHILMKMYNLNAIVSRFG